ncbi:MAG: hypothetical protein CL489_05830 [Acidobacteria bacterium]|nr:hypothetical protein [Acidobacteriota bacterium]
MLHLQMPRHFHQKEQLLNLLQLQVQLTIKLQVQLMTPLVLQMLIWAPLVILFILIVLIYGL